MEPDRKEVEELAYHYWEDRGRPLGSPDEDWFRAEAELGWDDSLTDIAALASAVEA